MPHGQNEMVWNRDQLVRSLVPLAIGLEERIKANRGEDSQP